MTETVEFEKQKLTQEPLCSSLLDRLSFGIYRSSIEGKLIYCNQSMGRIFGYDTIDQMLKAPAVNLYQSKADRGELIRKIIEDGFVDHHRVRFKKQNGSLFQGVLTATGIYAYDGALAYIEGIVREFSESDEKLQGVIEMAGGVAHRMNQPLTIINNLVLEILEGSHPDDPIHEKIIELSDQISVLNDISSKIRKIRKYEAMEYVAGTRIVDIDKAC